MRNATASAGQSPFKPGIGGLPLQQYPLVPHIEAQAPPTPHSELSKHENASVTMVHLSEYKIKFLSIKL